MSNRKYTMGFKAIQQSGQVNSNCAETAFINLGTTLVTINNVFPLAAGASIGFNGNADEIDVTQYNLVFATGQGLCIVVQKFYSSDLCL